MTSEILFNLNSTHAMFLLQGLCFILAILGCRGDKSEEAPLVIFFSLVPVIGYLIGAISVIVIIQRAWMSKGRCILGHDLQLTYDSEAEKWKNGRMPMRISMGGYTRYQCSCCKTEISHSWKAF